MDREDARLEAKKYFPGHHVQKLLQRMEQQLNNYNVKKKLHILYICCVLLPLIITDSIILAVIIREDQAANRYELKNVAEAVKYNLTAGVDNVVTIANNIYMNRYINSFMVAEYESPLDYYNSYLKCMQNSLFKSSIGSGNFRITMYADNSTIINGGEFARLETVRETQWYRCLVDSGKDIVLYPYYDDSKVQEADARRKISLIRKLNFYERDGCEKVLKIDMDYGNIVRGIVKMNYKVPVYVCAGNEIIFSNDGYTSIGKEFDLFQEWDKVGFQESFGLYGQELEIYVLKREWSVLQLIRRNRLLILFLICSNALLPWLFVKVINRSFTKRLQELSRAFESVEGDKLQKIPDADVCGEDEIGALMNNYNLMAARTNELIQTVYKDKLKKQEMDIARQHAELLALHSQINPHFLFNALESIRMHSILKQELETACMVERLAVMERQYVDWKMDSESIKEEMRFVEAYLELQKYRFGDRLSYRMEVDAGYQSCRIPKLTLVTFVENACVHGIENKAAPGWVFIRVYPKGTDLCLEIEDTGNGIKEPLLSELRDKMDYVTITKLKEKGSVGIANACLRLKLVTNNEVCFGLDSEEGAGTIVTVRIPLKYTGLF